MSFDEIKKLTLNQYAEICCHERDENGRLVPAFKEGTGRPADPKERAFARWRLLRGWSLDQCKMVWAENEAMQTYRAEIDKLGLSPEEFDRLVAEKKLELIRGRRPKTR